ncbi:hypothetical protein RCS94_10175 [Orbaceae bacterium ac157xtp]
MTKIAEEGSRVATRATALRRGLRVAALGNPYRSGNADHEKNTIIKQTETTALPQSFTKNNPNRQQHTTDLKASPLSKIMLIYSIKQISQDQKLVCL